MSEANTNAVLMPRCTISNDGHSAQTNELTTNYSEEMTGMIIYLELQKERMKQPHLCLFGVFPNCVITVKGGSNKVAKTFQILGWECQLSQS